MVLECLRERLRFSWGVGSRDKVLKNQGRGHVSAVSADRKKKKEVQKHGKRRGLGQKAFSMVSSLVGLGQRCCRKGWWDVMLEGQMGLQASTAIFKELGLQSEVQGAPLPENSRKSLRIPGL